MRLKLLIAAFLILPSQTFAGEITVNKFLGLNTQDSSGSLPDGNSPDLLNVDLTPGGFSVKKREGYGLYKTLTVSTSAVHGGHHFQDLAGNDIQLWGNDAFLSAIVGGATPIKVATGTLNATWQCTDANGFAYCMTSARDSAVRTDGTVSGSTYPNNVPQGTMITSSPNRLFAAGISGNTNTIYASEDGVFTNFTVALNDTSPYTEVIVAPGSRLTHIRYACGKILWWKDQSFGYMVGDTQFTLEERIVTPTIGTLDNSSAEYNGIVYFRGQDNHVYQYDCSNVTRLSREITPTVAAASRRKSNSWTQTTQANWSAGNFYPAVNFSTTVSVGDISLSSSSQSDKSSTTWSQGLVTTNLTINPSSITLNTNNSGNITNPDFESAFATNWSTSSADGFSNWGRATSYLGGCGTVNPQTGSAMARFDAANAAVTSPFLEMTDTNGALLQQQAITLNNDCTWRQTSLAAGSTPLGTRVKFRLHASWSGHTDDYLSTSDSYILGGAVSFYYNSTTGLNKNSLEIDNVTNGSSTITSGSFTSRTFDTAYTSSTIQLLSAFTTTSTKPSFDIRTSSSASGGPWTTIVASSASAVTPAGTANRYVVYSATITMTGSDSTAPYIQSSTFVYVSTGGVYYSAVNNAPSLASWDIFTANDQLLAGSISYFTRSSTNSFLVGSSTPSWVAQTKNALVASSTGTYFQARADFASVNSTSTFALNDFTFNWFEGSASDKAYLQYFNDHVWVAVSSGTSGTNNRIQRFDLLNTEWLLDDIAADGLVVDQGRLYFGDPTAGKIYIFGGGLSTDNAAAISAYWKSKDFTGDDPWVMNEYTSADFILKQASATVTATYTVDTSTSTSILVALYEPSRTMIRRSRNLAIGKKGTFYNIKISDNSTNAKWELFGHRVQFNPLTWSPN